MPSASHFEFDDSQWPLLIIRIPRTPTADEMEEYLARRLEYMKRHEHHVILYDTRELRLASNAMNQRQVEWLRKHDELILETLLGAVVIITSPLNRLTASAIMHFKKPTTPYSIASSMPDAVRWAADCLQQAGYFTEAHRIRQHFASSASGQSGA
ncbi:hypothetical protein [Vitiosangium sp. GDMCC 1.1324]|uniref:hypothetical protein n=1 Tax=Vitiosangium sp. (strain GDMCC 1.1324) TaxID=2138576 RepID=UPI000D364A41|nr:hypothetical protein [Vitiosangium sp. GDMCC 1.1324]PTL84558.1 hypothetical protein DAT35_05630 [Vitiosangium sp. GDMCC 1.1324]